MVRIGKLCCSEYKSFRTVFKLGDKSLLNWFPGHMSKGMKQMERKLKSIDCLVEVHDARIPFSGRNPESFQTICGLRPHILVYNKRDLADEKLETVVLNKHKANDFKNVIFTNCKSKQDNGIKELVPLVQKEILSSCRHNRSENREFCLMVVGVPNVGKSSIINALRSKYLLKGNAAHVGAVPGITRSVGEKIKICDDPLIYVLDTPGILTPKVISVHDGMRLALCATIPDKTVGIEIIADYLLFWLNKNRNFKYVEHLGINNASDDITEVLALYALERNFMSKRTDIEKKPVLVPDLNLAAFNFVDAFRKGLFGKITLDLDKLKFPVTDAILYKTPKRMNYLDNKNA